MNDHEQRARGMRAQALLDDPLLSEAFDALEHGYYEVWRDSNLRDTQGREQLFYAVQIIGKVRSHLQSVLQDGAIAAAQIEADIGRTPAAHRK